MRIPTAICTAVACRSVRLRCGGGAPSRWERRGPGRSRSLDGLPVDPGVGNGRRCAENYAGETPALPGGPPHSGRRLRRRALAMTDRELKVMAAAAIMGFRNRPNSG